MPSDRALRCVTIGSLPVTIPFSVSPEFFESVLAQDFLIAAPRRLPRRALLPLEILEITVRRRRTGSL
jgi:hypothetical protein